MAAQSQIRITNLEQELDQAKRELNFANLRIQQLEILLRELRVQNLGPRSENLSDLQQLLLLEQEPGATLDEVEAEAKREPINKKKRQRKPHPGRRPLPEHLPRVEETIACPAGECNCAHCGKEMPVIGYDESEVLDRQPAKYFVLVTRREKRACRDCADATVVSAPLAERIVEKGLASDAVVIDVVMGKYCDHLPLYRQEAILEREGIEIGRATLCGWVMRVGDLLLPVSGAMRKDLLAEPYLQVDETTVLVQMHDKRGSDHQAYLWQYGKPGGEMVFDFRMGRERDGPQKFLGQWEGILQTDGYQAYDGVGGPKLVHVGCWAHARRKFVDALKVNKDDVEAFRMVERMDELFAVDRHARENQFSVEQRLAWRRARADKWVEEIHAKCTELKKTVLPQSSLGKAVAYTLNMWIKLKRCLEYGEVELSNNLAENSMRPVALGRKNWLHVGHKDAGPKVAAIMSVVESCRRIGAPVREYLATVLPGLDKKTVREVEQLTPARWLAARREQSKG